MTAAELLSHLTALCGEDKFEVRITYRRFSPRSKRRPETVYQLALEGGLFGPECHSPLELLDLVRARMETRGALEPRRDEFVPVVIGANPRAAAAHQERICSVCHVLIATQARLHNMTLEWVCSQCPWPTHEDETMHSAAGED